MFGSAGATTSTGSIPGVPPSSPASSSLTSHTGFNTHSDGDVVAHAIIDALAGALGVGSLGDYFPKTTPLTRTPAASSS